MRVIVYGMKNEYEDCVAYMTALPQLQYRKIDYIHTPSYDEFISLLGREEFDIVAVLVDGAEGMEGVIASKTLCREGSVVWLSNDEGFGAQSYRLGCTFFGVKPLNEALVSDAISAYMKERVDVK